MREPPSPRETLLTSILCPVPKANVIALTGSRRPRSLIVVISPVSGKQRGRDVWHTVAAPVRRLGFPPAREPRPLRRQLLSSRRCRSAPPSPSPPQIFRAAGVACRVIETTKRGDAHAVARQFAARLAIQQASPSRRHFPHRPIPRETSPPLSAPVPITANPARPARPAPGVQGHPRGVPVGRPLRGQPRRRLRRAGRRRHRLRRRRRGLQRDSQRRASPRRLVLRGATARRREMLS